MKGIIRWKQLFFVMTIMVCLEEVYGNRMVRDPAFQSMNWHQRWGMIRQPETDSKSAIMSVPSTSFFAAKDGVLAYGTKTIMPHICRTLRTSKLCLAAAAGMTPAGIMDGSDETEEGRIAHVSIEYCTGCRWNLRSAWLMQELLTTFEEESNLHSVTMIPIRPPAPGGIFRVTVNDSIALWDRKIEGRFPEAKE
eukprot:scaffold53577_cov53-Attheya_sp.AAC.1